MLIALPCLLLGLAAGAGAKDTATASGTTTFGFTGGEQIFTVPDGVTSLEVLAVGGKGASPDGLGGFGAVATGKLAVTPGQTLFIEVGGNGGGGIISSLRAGFNGGGSGSEAISAPNDGGGGGGASDIRTISRAASGDTLGSRLIIAGGGGGGGGGSPSIPGGYGGSAGQLASGNGSNGNDSGGTGGSYGFGGTQTAGGFSWWGPSGLGQGGDGGPNSTTYGGGGGGGGKFGGGGASSSGSGAGGGGGGSTSFGPTATGTALSTDTTGFPLIRLTFNPSAGGGNKSGLKFGKVKLNKRKGTATLPVTIPGSGNLTVGGKGVVKKRPKLNGFSRIARKVDAAGTYKLKVKAKGRKKRKLFSTGKVRVKAVVSFKPTSGDKVKTSKRIRLKKN